MYNNVSLFSDGLTARTNKVCAEQRASALWRKGISKVLELCVGPSLPTLEEVYNDLKIECYGNDIEARWQKHYPNGKWVIGDAIKAFKDHNQIFDGVVFAPPLSNGCSGKRQDALMIYDVNPSYEAFIEALYNSDYKGRAVLVLPGRSKSTKEDREQFFKLIKKIVNFFIATEVFVMPIEDGCTKYFDIHIDANARVSPPLINLGQVLTEPGHGATF